MIEQLIIQAEPTRPRSARDGRHRSDAIVSIPRILNRSLSLRGPDSSPQWLQQEAAFIHKNQASLAFEALFLSAANRRGANGQSLPRLVRVPGAWAFAGSNRVCAANKECIRDNNGHRTNARSLGPPAGPSNRPAHIPNTGFLATKPSAIRAAAEAKAWARGRDAAWLPDRSLSAKPPSTDAPKKRWSRRSQPLPTISCPARTTGPRSCDGLRARRACLMVSCHNTSAKRTFFH